MKICGKEFTVDVITKIKEWAGTSGMTRSHLSKTVCEWLGWYAPKGDLKEKK